MCMLRGGKKKKTNLHLENINIWEGKLCALGVWRSVRGNSLHMDSVWIWLSRSGSFGLQVFIEQGMI